MHHTYALTRDINYVQGPDGQRVVVVRPNQTEIAEMEEVEQSVGFTICAFCWGVLAFPFILIGFSLTCVGLSKLESDPGHPVLRIGLIFFGLGLFMGLFFWIVMCFVQRAQQSRVEKYMHRPGQGESAEDMQPMLLPPVEDSDSTLSPYQRFVMYRGSENASSGTSIGGQIPYRDHTFVSPSAPPQENTITGISQSQYLSSAPRHSFTFDDPVELPESSTSSSRMQRHRDIPSSNELRMGYTGSSTGYGRHPRESEAIPRDVVQGIQFEEISRRSGNLPRASGNLSSPSEPITAFRSSTSEVSLDHLLGDLTALSSSLGQQLDEETSSFPVREIHPPVQEARHSGRRSPYDNSFP